MDVKADEGTKVSHRDDGNRQRDFGKCLRWSHSPFEAEYFDQLLESMGDRPPMPLKTS